MNDYHTNNYLKVHSIESMTCRDCRTELSKRRVRLLLGTTASVRKGYETKQPDA